MRRDSPPFGVFGDSLTSMIGRLRFAGGLSSRRLDTGVDADVLAAYNDGSAGIVLCASDAGVLAVLNADLGASNLPRTSAFVPMLAELVGQMLDRGRATEAAYCGEPLVVHLPRRGRRGGRPAKCAGRERPATETAPGRYGELVDEAVGAVWRWSSPGPPGVYRVQRDGTPVFALAVNIPRRGEPARRAAARGADQPAGRRTRGGLSRRRRRGPAPR